MTNTLYDITFYLHCSKIYSTTSTLSAGSTGSQARLIQSSHQPENYHPMQVEDLGKQNSTNTKTIKAEVHTARSKSPKRSPKKSSAKLDSNPNYSRKSSPSSSSRKSSPKSLRKTEKLSKSESTTSSQSNEEVKSPKKIKSSLKQPSKSLSIENPTCVECYLSGKNDKR